MSDRHFLGLERSAVPTQRCDELAQPLRQNGRIIGTGEQQHWFAAQVGRLKVRQCDLRRAQQDCARKRLGPQQKQGRSHIGAIRIPNRDRRRKAVTDPRFRYEIRKLVARRRTSSSSSSSGAKRRKNRVAPVSNTLPRGDKSGACGANLRPNRSRDISSPPVPCSSRSRRTSRVAEPSKQWMKGNGSVAA